MRLTIIPLIALSLMACATPYATLDGLTLTPGNWEQALAKDPLLTSYHFPTSPEAETYAQSLAQDFLMQRYEWREIERLGLEDEPGIQDRLKIVDVAAASAWLQENHFGEQCEITPEEIQAFHRENNHLFTSPDGIFFRHIALPEDAHELATSLVEAARDEGADFAALAQEHGQGLSPNTGQVFGPIRPQDVNEQIAETLWAMQPSEISEPFALGGNLHILQVVERRPRTIPLARAQGQIAMNLRRQCLEAQVDDVVAQADHLGITVHPLPMTLTEGTPLLSGAVDLTVGDLASRLGTDLTEDESSAGLIAYIQAFMEDHILAAYVDQEGLGDERLTALEDDIRHDILFRIMAQRRADALPPLTEQVARQRYRNMAASQFTEPVRLQIRSLVLEADQNTLPVELHRLARELRAQWEAGADFAALIVDHSNDPAAADPRWIYPAGADVDPYGAAASLATDEVSHPIEHGRSVMLVQALARQESHLLPYEEVRDEIFATLPGVIADSQEQRYWKSIQEQVIVTIPDEVIEQFVGDAEHPRTH